MGVNDLINKSVLKGLLPVAFYNSKNMPNLIKSNKGIIGCQKENKYKHIQLPEAKSHIIISKIYELF